jgi:hypothetical protein
VISFGDINKFNSNTSQAEIGGGGNFVKMQSREYDLVLNVLLGIRRGLGDLSNSLPQSLTAHNYEQTITV